ncbi:hypothetical protein KJ780_04835 [Candidatus Micrarchaeota archaeon]|nr:hypothetical protein [Candidatus Micrarchaeota archaeon]
MPEFKGLVEEMKGKGIETALLKSDGGLVYSNFAMDDPAPFISRYLANNAHFLMDELGDDTKEIELSLENRILMIVPLNGYLLLALVKNKEEKKVFRDYIETIKKTFFK